MSHIKSEIGMVLVASAIIFTALVASSVTPAYATDGNSSSINNTSAPPPGGSNATNATSATGTTTNGPGSTTSK